MGYYIRKLAGKRNWKLQFVSYKKKDSEGFACRRPQRTWDIPIEQYFALGFHKGMSFEQAQARQRQVNAKSELKRFEELRIAAARDLENKRKNWEVVFPNLLTHEFEKRFVHSRFPTQPGKSSRLGAWRAAQRIVVELRIEPWDWHQEAFWVYDWFNHRRYSMSYVCKVLRVLNLWGFYYCRQMGKAFQKVPNPTGFEKNRLMDSYFEKTGGWGRESEPITPHALEAQKSRLKEAHYNWLFLSIWFGLRPHEVDLLRAPDSARVETDRDGTLVLWINQSKLVSVPPRFRWKLIPAILPEQRRAIELVSGRTGHTEHQSLDGALER